MTRPTRVAEVSAPGRGAIATLRVWGPDALAVADAAFRPARAGGKPLAVTPAGRPRVGRIGVGQGDEVVAVILNRDPAEVEVQCHGGPAAVGLVVAGLADAGAMPASSRAWGRHAAGSATRAESLDALAQAPTLRVAEVLRDQADGALDADLARAVDSLDEGNASRAVATLDDLIRRGAFGVRLLDGWRVVLAGRPNVGKSRLLNALAGFDRAIVDPTAGTTRDVVTAATAFGGWPVELADTAGLRIAADPIEAEGVARARARQAAADLVVVVLDRSEPLTPEDRAVLRDHPTALVVANKADLLPAWDAIDLESPSLIVSAERGDGVEAVAAAIRDRLAIDIPPADAGVPFRPAHVRRLGGIRRALVVGDAAWARRSLVRWLGWGDGPKSGAIRGDT